MGLRIQDSGPRPKSYEPLTKPFYWGGGARNTVDVLTEILGGYPFSRNDVPIHTVGMRLSVARQDFGNARSCRSVLPHPKAFQASKT